MANRTRIPDPLLNVGRGFLMGGADIIPGVSGGTVALILGIYERLVNAISRFDLTFLGHVRKGEVAAAARHIDLVFLGTLLLGIGIGVVGLGGLMHYLLEEQLQYTFGAFFGLILASSWHVARIIDRWNVQRAGYMVVGAVGAFFLVALPVFDKPPDSVWYILACGCVSICAMILPGISGAFILLILGAYSELTGAIDEIKHGRIGGDVPLTLAAFAVGATIGILSFTKFLKWLLQRYEPATMAVLCGFMIGSLRKIWPFKFDLNPEETKFKLKEFRNEWPDWSAGDVWATIGLAVVAFGFVLLLERFGAAGSHSTPNTPGDA
jgi:putative membrane protein